MLRKEFHTLKVKSPRWGLQVSVPFGGDSLSAVMDYRGGPIESVTSCRGYWIYWTGLEQYKDVGRLQFRWRCLAESSVDC